MTSPRGPRARSLAQARFGLVPWLRACLGALCLSGGALATEPPPPLPALALDARHVSVSGLSSGGYMAVQFQVAHAASLSGAAVIAGGPYGCAAGSVTSAMFTCSCPYDTSEGAGPVGTLSGWVRGACLQLPATLLASRARLATEHNARHIDSPRALRRHRVWLYSGDADPVVFPTVVDALERFYVDMKVPQRRLKRVREPDAGHAMPTTDAGECSVTRPPFINGCRFDGAGELLNWLHPSRGPRPQPGQARDEALRPFDQRPHRQAGAFDGLDDSGWVYVPQACRAEGARCGLHVVFHGCEQGQSFRMGTGAGEPYGTRYVQGAGYNRWAEALGLVVLYPQVRASEGVASEVPFQYNPKGCWDFWGYTLPRSANAAFSSGPPYARQDAPQIRAVKSMVDALLSPRP